MKKNEAMRLINQADFRVLKLPPATKDEIIASETIMEKIIPNELREFYSEVSNGMVFGRLEIFPLSSKNNRKKTWNSIGRNNSVDHSVWFNEDEFSIREFLVFCSEGAHRCFAFRCGNDFVWQWNRGDEEIIELDCKFWDWLCESLSQEKYC